MTCDAQHVQMLAAIEAEGFRASDQLKPVEIELLFDSVVGGKTARINRLPKGQQDCLGDYVAEMDAQCGLADGLPCAVKSRCRTITLLQQKADKLKAKKKK